MQSAIRSIGVVIPVYNRPGSVVEAMRCVASQTLSPQCLIVVDDGSTDHTAATIEHWLAGRKLPFEHRLIRQANGGPSLARNVGAAAAGAVDALAFLDSDDLWPDDFLARMAVGLTRPGCVAVSCDRRVVDDRKNHARMLSARHLIGSVTGRLLAVYCPNPSSTLIDAAAYVRAGGFDPRYRGIEDFDLFLRLSLLGDWDYVPGMTVTYRQFQTSSPPLTDLMRTGRQHLAMIHLFRRFLTRKEAMATVSHAQQAEFYCVRWHAMGKALMREGRAALAAGCFARALGHRPLHVRSINRWIQATAMRGWKGIFQ